MIERIAKKYRLLFEVRLLHHYWLDEGAKVFDTLPKEKRETRLQQYDRSTFLHVEPTGTTKVLLKGLGGIYKDTALGYIVGVPVNEVISNDTIFEFSITIKDPAFFNYTALTLRPQKIFEISFQPENNSSEEQLTKLETFRYKENVFVFSNLTGATRGPDTNKTLFLSREIPALQENDLVESLILSEGALIQLTIDAPDPNPLKLSDKATNFPVFVNQADVPAIVFPNGISDISTKGITLTNNVPDNIFALIQLSAKREDDADFNLVNRANDLNAKQQTSPVFEIRFKNRSTVWKYLNKKNGELKFEEPEPLPLTYFGTAGKKERPKPAEGLVKLEERGDSEKKTPVSNIFI